MATSDNFFDDQNQRLFTNRRYHNLIIEFRKRRSSKQITRSAKIVLFYFCGMESFSVDEISSYTNSIITFVLNGCSTKLPIKEKDMTATINAKGNSFQMALKHAKDALQQVCLIYKPIVFN